MTKTQPRQMTEAQCGTVRRMTVDIVNGKGHRWSTNVVEQAIQLIAHHGDAKMQACFSLLDWELDQRKG